VKILEVSVPLDVSLLKNLTNLKSLALRGFDLQNTEGLARLPNLEYFSTELYDTRRYANNCRFAVF